MKLTTRDMVLVAIIPALMGATSLISIPLGSLPPITLQTLFVFLAGLLLRKELAFLSMVIYILLGIIGLPVFSSGTSGIGIVIGPTGGFIMAFPFAAFIVAILKNVNFLNKEVFGLFDVLLAANLFIYIVGGAYFMYSLDWNLSSTVALFGTYIPGDIIKILAAIYAYISIRSHIHMNNDLYV